MRRIRNAEVRTIHQIWIYAPNSECRSKDNSPDLDLFAEKGMKRVG